MGERETCRFCGGPDQEDGMPTNSGTCGDCWYGMRMDPDGWEARLKEKGRRVRYQGGCIAAGSVIVCRDPYAPSHLQSVPAPDEDPDAE